MQHFFRNWTVLWWQFFVALKLASNYVIWRVARHAGTSAENSNISSVHQFDFEQKYFKVQGEILY